MKYKTYSFPYFRFLIALFFLMCSLSSCQKGLDETETNNPPQAVQTSIPQPTKIATLIPILPTPSTSLPTPTPFVEEERVEKKGIDQADEIVNRWNAKFISSSGWLHLLYSRSSDVDLLYSTNEEWVFINDQGLVDKSVATVKDQAGNITQQVIFNHGTMVNEMIGDKQNDVPAYRFKPDFGFLQYLKDADANGTQIDVQQIEYQGTPSLAFSYEVAYANPKKLGNSPDLVKNLSVFGSFNLQNDAMNQFLITYKLINGNDLVFDKIQVHSIEKQDPPKEVINLLENMVK